MKFQKLFLNYKEDNEKIYDKLISAVQDMEKINGFLVEEFYEDLDKIIRELSQNNSFETVRKFPQKKPIYLFGVLFYCLKEMDINNKLEKEFNYLREFIDCKIDVLMIVNHLKEM